MTMPKREKKQPKPKYKENDGFKIDYEKPPIKAVSYSSINSMLGSWACPYKLAMEKVEKVTSDDNSALVGGIAAHDAAEHYVKGIRDDLDPVLHLFEDYFNYLREEYKNGWIHVEDQWAVNNKWEEVDYWAKDVWFRIKIDLFFLDPDEEGVLNIIDYKTGKARGEYVEQVELYALAAFMLYSEEDVQEVRGGLWFFDCGSIRGVDSDDVPDPRYVFTRADVPRLMKKWNNKARALTECSSFIAVPGGQCKYCHLPDYKGGTCRAAKKF